MNTLSQMRQAVNDGTAKVLTLALAKELKGKKIRTIYFGYRGQDGVDEFIVGDIISEFELATRRSDEKFGNHAKYLESYMTERQLDEVKTKLVLLKDDETYTAICCHTKYWNCFNELTFTCSDADRAVYFIELPTFVITHANCGNYGNLRLQVVKLDHVAYQEHDNAPYDVYLLRYPDGTETTFSRNTFDYEN